MWNDRAFTNYDSWLERPYQDMLEESDRYIDWCESMGLDPDTEEADIAYCDWMDSQYDYDPYDDDYDEEEADYYYDPLPE